MEMLNIVLVEDDPADAQMLREALLEAGMPLEIKVIEDGIEAAEYLTHASECDLVLLDLNVPRLTGFEILERIRSCEQSQSLPVVVVSGSTDPAGIERCYRAGANSYVCKPIHVDEIFAMANQLVRYWSQCVSLPARRAAKRETQLAGMRSG